MTTAKVAPLIDLHETVTNIDQVIMEIHGFLVTSSHYTPRDKREIMAQMPVFEMINEMIIAVDADNKAKQGIRNAGIAAKKQLVLYYMVGKHGWPAALHTMNATLDKNLGMPDLIQPPAAPIQYKPPAPARQASYGYRAQETTHRKPSRRGSGGPPRR